MKQVTSLKSSKTESPKTAGGISKSLLTPCRRVGLSRNWKKAGPSPFVSPLAASNSTPVEPELVKKETRKRKVRTITAELDEDEAESPKTSLSNDSTLEVEESAITISKDKEMVGTPLRHVAVPRRKKSKTLLSALSKCIDGEVTTKLNEEAPLPKDSFLPTPASTISEVNENSQEQIGTTLDQETVQEALTDPVSTPVRSKSKNMNKKRKSPKNMDITTEKNCNVPENTIVTNPQDENEEKVCYEIKKRSPDNLTKECIVVIQKKLFKTNKLSGEKETTTKAAKNTVPQAKDIVTQTKNTVSQTLFDSDSDEVPLCQLNSKTTKNVGPEIITIDDHDFETDAPVKKLAHKNTSTSGLKPAKTKSKTKAAKPEKASKYVVANLADSFDDDEDFDFDNKKTILIKKTYEKVSKPQKAKSTGSITQRDIDELRARIQLKKKMLMAKVMTEDTEELRTLIKKWQKGCQDALVELMELMKSKFPEKQGMDYAEMLQTLKIPALLVGYDEDNDCFTTPDDENIVLAKFKDL